MPQLPSAYTALLEVNKVATRESSQVYEYLDFGRQLLRTDHFDGGAMTSVVRDFTALTKHTVTDPDVYDDPYDGFDGDDACATEAIGALTTGDRYFDAETRHMRSPHDVFVFSSDGKERYIGTDYARGVKCNQWYAEG